MLADSPPDERPTKRKNLRLDVTAARYAWRFSPRAGAPPSRLYSGLLLLALAGMAEGCSAGLTGEKYASLPDGGFAACAIEFRPSHKAYLTMAGQTIAAEYSVDGDRITFDTHSSPATVLTRTRDGTLTGGGFLCGTLKKTQ